MVQELARVASLGGVRAPKLDNPQAPGAPHTWTVEQLTGHARYLFYTARQTPIAIEEGRDWYRRIHCFARNLAREYSLPMPLVATIVSLCSQNQLWSLAMMIAEKVCQQIAKGGPVTRESIPNLNTHQVVKAMKLVMHEDDFDSQLLVLNGPKLMAFAENILQPETSTAVTIDCHIARAFGVESGQLSGKYGHDDTVYTRIARAIQNIAEEVGYLPSEVQAVIWVDVRGSAT